MLKGSAFEKVSANVLVPNIHRDGSAYFSRKQMLSPRQRPCGDEGIHIKAHVWRDISKHVVTSIWQGPNNIRFVIGSGDLFAIKLVAEEGSGD